MEQRTQEWYEARLGKLTASRAATAFDVYKIGAKKGAPTETAKKLILEMAYERTTGNRIETPLTLPMRWGVEHEDEARNAYINQTGNEVTQVGFIDHHEIDMFGASPDGLVGSDGLLEIKCPSELVHLQRIEAGEVPPEYRTQMLVQMVCTGRKWCDFVDYDPRNTLIPLFVVRFEPTEEELRETEEKAKAFLTLVDEKVNELRTIAAQYKAEHSEIWDEIEVNTEIEL